MNSRKHLCLSIIVPALIFLAGPALADPPQAMCAMGPLKCPDGTYVFPGPGCTFGPCPGKPLPAPQPAPVPFKCPPNAMCATPIVPLKPVAPDQDGSGANENGSDDDRGQGVEDGQSTEPNDQGNIIIDRDHAADSDAEQPIYVQQGSAGTATIGPGRIVSPGQPSPGFPDNPLEAAPDGSMTVSFLFEHRTALNQKHVTVHGTIVSTLLADKACPPGRGMCAQPRITLGDAVGNAAYQLEVLLPESDKTAYETGQVVEISGIASAGPATVVVRKE